jgi:hypothetical protein
MCTKCISLKIWKVSKNCDGHEQEVMDWSTDPLLIKEICLSDEHWTCSRKMSSVISPWCTWAWTCAPSCRQQADKGSHASLQWSVKQSFASVVEVVNCAGTDRYANLPFSNTKYWSPTLCFCSFSNPFTHPHYASVVPTHSPTIVNGVYAIIKKKIQANCCTSSHPILLDFQLSVQGKRDIVACRALKQFNKAWVLHKSTLGGRICNL